MTELRNAATAVLIRDGEEGLETLLLKRSNHGIFSKMWVFPGGAVDSADAPQGSDEAAAALTAAVRECHEEAGVRLAPEELEPFAHWTAPKGISKRFATWFFLAPLRRAADVVIDDHEIVDYRWMRPAQALRAHKAGELPMAPPTFVTLSELHEHGDCDSALAAYRQRGVFHYAPRFGGKSQNELLVLYNGDAGYAEKDPQKADGPIHRMRIIDDVCHYEKAGF